MLYSVSFYYSNDMHESIVVEYHRSETDLASELVRDKGFVSFKELNKANPIIRTFNVKNTSWVTVKKEDTTPPYKSKTTFEMVRL
jgi:hypothetical protein